MTVAAPAVEPRLLLDSNLKLAGSNLDHSPVVARSLDPGASTPIVCPSPSGVSFAVESIASSSSADTSSKPPPRLPVESTPVESVPNRMSDLMQVATNQWSQSAQIGLARRVAITAAARELINDGEDDAMVDAVDAVDSAAVTTSDSGIRFAAGGHDKPAGGRSQRTAPGYYDVDNAAQKELEKALHSAGVDKPVESKQVLADKSGESKDVSQEESDRKSTVTPNWPISQSAKKSGNNSDKAASSSPKNIVLPQRQKITSDQHKSMMRSQEWTRISSYVIDRDFSGALESQLTWLVNVSQTVVHPNSPDFDWDCPARSTYDINDEDLVVSKYDSKPSIVQAVVPTSDSTAQEPTYHLLPFVHIGAPPDGQCTAHALNMTREMEPNYFNSVATDLTEQPFDYALGLPKLHKNINSSTIKFRQELAAWVSGFEDFTTSGAVTGWLPTKTTVEAKAQSKHDYETYKNLCTAAGIVLHDRLALKGLAESLGDQSKSLDQTIDAVVAVRDGRTVVEFRYAAPSTKNDLGLIGHQRLDSDRLGGLLWTDYSLVFHSDGASALEALPDYSTGPIRPLSILHYIREASRASLLVGHTEALFPAPEYYTSLNNHPYMNAEPTRLVPAIYLKSPTIFFAPVLFRRTWNEDGKIDSNNSIQLRVGVVVNLLDGEGKADSGTAYLVVAMLVRLSRQLTRKLIAQTDEEGHPSFPDLQAYVSQTTSSSDSTVVTESDPQASPVGVVDQMPFTPTTYVLLLELTNSTPKHADIVHQLENIEANAGHGHTFKLSLFDQVAPQLVRLAEESSSFQTKQVLVDKSPASKSVLVVSTPTRCQQQIPFNFGSKFVAAAAKFLAETNGANINTVLNHLKGRNLSVVDAYSEWLDELLGGACMPMPTARLEPLKKAFPEPAVNLEAWASKLSTHYYKKRLEDEPIRASIEDESRVRCRVECAGLSRIEI